MLKFYVDFNHCEDADKVIVRLDIRLNAGIREDEMKVGDKVILNDETMECEAILQHGRYEKWVAHIVGDTIRDIPEDQWSRFLDK